MPWNIRYKRVVIERVGLAARDFIKDAERSLRLARDLKPIDYGIRYFEPVSLGTLASQMISNLSQDVVYNGMTICDIYEACCENWVSIYLIGLSISEISLCPFFFVNRLAEFRSPQPCEETSSASHRSIHRRSPKAQDHHRVAIPALRRSNQPPGLHTTAQRLPPPRRQQHPRQPLQCPAKHDEQDESPPGIPDRVV